MMNNMKKTAYVWLLACLPMFSCSEDDSKLTFASDSVYTGNVTDITSTSAVINGYFSFYGEVNDFIGDVDYTELIDSGRVSKEEFEILLRDYYHIYDKVDISKLPDSVSVYATPYDVQFVGAGYRISRYHDFRESKLVISDETKIRHYSSPIDGLTPDVTYYYKTALVFRPIFVVDCAEAELHEINIALGDWYDYFVYGATKKFTTLP